jgi:sugar/nucleoside kinase (ribokinase family)
MEKRFDVLVVGELNVDLILDGLGTFPEVGKEVLANKMNLVLGSSSAIFASNISSLGAMTAYIGKIGKDKFGEVVLGSLRKSGVDVSMIKVDGQLGTGATVILNVGEDRAMVTYPGAMEHLTVEEIADDDLRKAHHLHFSSCFLQPGMRGGLGELFRRAKKLGLTTSFDMQWDPAEKWDLDIAEILPNVDVFLPNEIELMCLTGTSNLEEAIRSLSKYSGILAVKRGNRGSLVRFREKTTDLPAFLNTKVVDAIGAGDSFNAGFVFRFIKGCDIADCQWLGNLAGAVSTTAPGGTAAFMDFERFKKVAKEQFGVEL